MVKGEHMKKKNLIVIAVLLISALILVVQFGGVMGLNSSKAEKTATEYVQKLYNKTPQGVSCSNSDSDGDGYVSCDVNTGDKVILLECPTFGSFFNTKCKTRLIGKGILR
jgi:flagellar basal body-associated protein FliL